MGDIVLTNPFEGIDFGGVVETLGGWLLDAATSMTTPILVVGAAIAAIPMGIRLFKRLSNRVA